MKKIELDMELAVSMYEKQESITDIASFFGVSRSMLRGRLQAAGVRKPGVTKLRAGDTYAGVSDIFTRNKITLSCSAPSPVRTQWRY